MSGFSAYNALVRRIAPSEPCIGSVKITSAPNAFRMRLRSGVTLPGTHSRTRKPRAAPSMA